MTDIHVPQIFFIFKLHREREAIAEEEGRRDEMMMKRRRKRMGKVSTLSLPLSAQTKEAAATIIQ